MVTAKLRAVRLDITVNQCMILLSNNKIMSLAKWKHGCWCWKSSTRLIDLSSTFPTDTSEGTAYQLRSHLYYTMGAMLQHNPHYLGFVWRKPANCITLISQAVFIQVITMPRTVVKRSICHLNDFSIFPFSGINLSWARTLTWLFLKYTEENTHWILNTGL